MKVFDELAQRLKQEYQTLSLGSGAGLEDTNYRQLLLNAQQLVGLVEAGYLSMLLSQSL
jgi:hypothetical protein